MSAKVRPNPLIPDHEVLRKIGGGAYGEVWLARGVTGALRAVKVVWREDFEDERGFEREFEGILKFEPISRDHPALVNILHVGRSPEGNAFYYYVMELGDDVLTGREINPIEYEPRTLRADHHQGPGVQWDTEDCIDVGLRLAEALEHLHENGLAHRDVKPSNVIFVNGRAKLADIGLVAARGQRTFVGTEGFVPPEGPGSSQADVYSLGKVLYEIATGKDRMNFPELPDDMPSGKNRKRWLELNRIICDICEPRVSKRKISTAGQLAESLKRIQRGKRRHRSGTAVLLTTMLLLAFSLWAGWMLVKDTDEVKSWMAGPAEPPPAVGMLRVFSNPEGADVLDSNGVLVGTTPTSTMTARVGEDISFTIRMNGYHPLVVEGRMTIAGIREPMALSGQLQVFSPPQQGELWMDHLGGSYQPVENRHVGSGYVTEENWARFIKDSEMPDGKTETVSFSQNGKAVNIVLASQDAAEAYCAWLRSTGIEAGFLTESHEVSHLREKTFDNPGVGPQAKEKGLRPFRVMVRQIIYGEIQLSSEPPGADVYLNGVEVGTTDQMLDIQRVKPGEVQLLLVLEGFKPLSRKLTLREGELLVETLVLEKNQGVVFGQDWENGVQMKFVPLGEDLMASVWETRVGDYELFVREAGHAVPRAPSFDQGSEHPVVNVSRESAQAFCAWLTERERRDERISQTHVYRLPTDLEWSQMVGLEEEEGVSPGSRDARKSQVFPWGFGWPDGEKHGNFADMTAGTVPGVSIDKTIPGYDDGYAYTAPVGSFPANELGIHDLSGNVQEWVGDEYSSLGPSNLGVLRGGGWNTYQIENLYSGSRNAVPPTYEDSIYGFRVVLAKDNQKEE